MDMVLFSTTLFSLFHHSFTTAETIDNMVTRKEVFPYLYISRHSRHFATYVKCSPVIPYLNEGSCLQFGCIY